MRVTEVSPFIFYKLKSSRFNSSFDKIYSVNASESNKARLLFLVFSPITSIIYKIILFFIVHTNINILLLSKLRLEIF